jgi:hypothetical protein
MYRSNMGTRGRESLLGGKAYAPIAASPWKKNTAIAPIAEGLFSVPPATAIDSNHHLSECGVDPASGAGRRAGLLQIRTLGVLTLDNADMLEHLEALAHTLRIPIRYERMEGETTFPSGGLCRIKGNPVIIVNMRAATGEKVRTIAHALRRFDLSRIYLKPALRDLLEKTDSHPQNSEE